MVSIYVLYACVRLLVTPRPNVPFALFSAQPFPRIEEKRSFRWGSGTSLFSLAISDCLVLVFVASWRLSPSDLLCRIFTTVFRENPIPFYAVLSVIYGRVSIVVANASSQEMVGS